MKRFVALCGLLVACGTPPEENACEAIVQVEVNDGGVPGASDGHDHWVVGGWTSGRVRYTPFTTFAIPHGLGRAPTRVVCQASFSPDGPLAEQSGSVCLWLTRCGAREGRTDREVLVRNSGSQEFWVRFVIE